MRLVLLDTHVWAWTLVEQFRLTKSARRAIEDATMALVSPISFFEIARKVRLGKWPEMRPYVDQLAGLVERQGASLASLEPAICVHAGLMAWDHRDPFDRLLAATALHHDLPLISADTAFDAVLSRIW